MADPISPVPDLSQFNYTIGDTVEVVTKQNGVNAAIDNLVVDINSTIDSINDDVDFFTTARDEIDAANIVHAPGSGLANEAGTAYSEDAQTSTYDATAGRLTKVGAFGGYGRLSSESLNVYPLTDMNSNPSTVRSGRYSVSNLSGTLNMPFPTAPPDAFGVVEVIPQDANNRVILKATDGGDLSLNGAGDVYERIWWLGSWTTPWRKVGEAKYRNVVGAGDVYARGGIVGTVTQSGGVPTGAIIERGNNSDGTWIKFADGTLICTQSMDASPSVQTPIGSIFQNSSTSWTYPYQFVSEPIVSPSVNRTVPGVWTGLGNNASTTISTSFQVFAAVPKTGIPTVRLSAIGRWF